MAVLKLKRFVVECFVEATKTTLEQLGTYRLSLQQEGTPGPPELTRTYGDVRRLRDYLQRCTCVRRDEIEVDMSDADQRLLVACFRRAADLIEFALCGRRTLGPDEAISLRKKLDVVAHWAFELASHPLLELPLSQLSASQPYSARALHARLQQKVKAEKQELEKASLPTMASESEEMPRLKLIRDPFRIAIDEPPEPPQSDAATPAPAAAASTRLLDSNRVHDLRLRDLINTDLASYARCVAAGDYRLAEVLLGCVMESALLDHALPRRSELGLSGPPETWNLKQVLTTVMGDRCSSRDRSLIGNLFSARTLLRPAVQLLAPTSVTSEGFESLREFVQRAMTDLHYSEESPNPSPQSCATADPSPDAPAKDPSAP